MDLQNVHDKECLPVRVGKGSRYKIHSAFDGHLCKYIWPG